MPTADQKYTVLHNQVGPLPQKTPEGKPFTFTTKEFIRLHPAPKDVDAGDYHEGLIQRLLDLKAIAPAANDAKPDVTPLGPENATVAPVRPATQAPAAAVPVK